MWYALSGGLLVQYESTPDEVQQQQLTRKNYLSYKTKPQRSSNSLTEDINIVGTIRVNLEDESSYKSLTALA